ncbi:MAG TPA: FHA domain-containing protein [Polyangiaceae bacterium]|jgi:hypothetical protein
MSRIFGTDEPPPPPPLGSPGSVIARARAAELRGELVLATALFVEAGRTDEAARVILLRGDAEAEPAARLRHYAHAVATAPVRSHVHAHARRKHAASVIAMAARGPLTSATKEALARAAADLEALDDHAGAARAYAQAGDLEGQARALTRAGELDALETLLTEEQQRDRDAATHRRTRDEFALLVASGQRRQAVDLARTSADDRVKELGRALRSRGELPDPVRLILSGRCLGVVFGDEIVIGRSPGYESREGARVRTGLLRVPSPAVSRRHLLVWRRTDGVAVRDLGSRHGTTEAGLPWSGEALVGDGIELHLGHDVDVVLRPTAWLEGAVEVVLGGQSVVAPLGPARVGVGWRIDRIEEGWLELSTEGGQPAFAASLQLAERTTLVAGDALASERNGRSVLEILPNVA